MTLHISYIFLFGLITLIHGKPADKRGGSLRMDVLKNLFSQQGAFDIALSHHEDGPRTHDEDTAKISPYIDNLQSRESFGKEDHYSTMNSIESFNKRMESRPSSATSYDKNNILHRLFVRSSCSKYAKCREWFTDINNLKHDRNDKGECQSNESDKNENIINLRCNGNRCSRSRSDRGDTDGSIGNYIKCIRKRCRLDNYHNINDRDSLRVARDVPCIGNRCGKSKEARDNLRCSGDRCSRNKDDNNRSDTANLRCFGNRCGRNIEEYNRDDTPSLRFSKERFTRDNEDYNIDDSNRSVRDYIKCIGKRCRVSNNPFIGERSGRSREERQFTL